MNSYHHKNSNSKHEEKKKKQRQRWKSTWFLIFRREPLSLSLDVGTVELSQRVGEFLWKSTNLNKLLDLQNCFVNIFYLDFSLQAIRVRHVLGRPLDFCLIPKLQTYHSKIQDGFKTSDFLQFYEITQLLSYVSIMHEGILGKWDFCEHWPRWS